MMRKTRPLADWGKRENTEYQEHSQHGKVYRIGAGPGDVELITVKGLRCLRQADVVLYDRLINRELLDELRPGTEKVFVGKEPGCHAISLPDTMVRAAILRPYHGRRSPKLGGRL